MTDIKGNFMWQSAYQVLEMLLPLITSPILARALGPEGVGIYSYLSVILGYFILVADLGIYQYGVRKIAAVQYKPEERNRTFWEIFLLHMGISGIVGVAYFVYVLKFSEYRELSLIMGVSYLGSVCSIHWLFHGMEDFRRIAIRNMTVKLLSFVLIVILVHDANDLMSYVMIMSFCSLLNCLICFFLCGRYINRPKLQWKHMFFHFKGMSVLFIVALMESLYNNIDRFMLGLMNEKEEVGYYENACKALIARTLVYSVATVLMPRMSVLLAGNETEKIKNLMRKSTSITILFSVAFGFGTAAVAREFSQIFWGKDFAPCSPLIMMMAFTIPAVTLSREIRQQYLVPANRDRDYLLSAIAGSVCDIFLNFVLIPGYGARGAAFATLVTEFVVLGVQIWVVRKELPFLQYIKENFIYVVFGLIMFVCVRKAGMILGIHIYSLILEILMGAIIYSILCVTYWKLTKNSYYFKI